MQSYQGICHDVTNDFCNPCVSWGFGDRVHRSDCHMRLVSLRYLLPPSMNICVKITKTTEVGKRETNAGSSLTSGLDLTTTLSPFYRNDRLHPLSL